jgi:two-component system chemotaxis response regulator CheB
MHFLVHGKQKRSVGMPGRDIVVIGASAGGVETLCSLVASLPADLGAAVFVVVHFPTDQVSFLPRILGRSGPLPAFHARSGERIQPGRIYVAPPTTT